MLHSLYVLWSKIYHFNNNNKNKTKQKQQKKIMLYYALSTAVIILKWNYVGWIAGICFLFFTFDFFFNNNRENARKKCYRYQWYAASDDRIKCPSFVAPPYILLLLYFYSVFFLILQQNSRVCVFSELFFFALSFRRLQWPFIVAAVGLVGNSVYFIFHTLLLFNVRVCA